MPSHLEHVAHEFPHRGQDITTAAVEGWLSNIANHFDYLHSYDRTVTVEAAVDHALYDVLDLTMPERTRAAIIRKVTERLAKEECDIRNRLAHKGRHRKHA
jgi:predicted regulator of amino acid metabolism with ACT domain